MDEWPPANGRLFVHSDEFGRIVVDEAKRLAKAYPTLDLADAVATTFQWFNAKLNANGHFINRRRFPTQSKFKAYIRQTLYNAGRRAYRLRKSGKEISALPADRPVVDSPLNSADRKERLHQLVEQLVEPHKTIFNRYFFDEDPLHLIAGALDMDEEGAQKIYEEAVDQLRRFARKSNIH